MFVCWLNRTNIRQNCSCCHSLLYHAVVPGSIPAHGCSVCAVCNVCVRKDTNKGLEEGERLKTDK